MEPRHLAIIVVIAVVAGVGMGLVMFPEPASTTSRNYDSMSRLSVIAAAAMVVFVAMVCFALVILKQQTIRSSLSPREAKPKRRRAAKKQPQQRLVIATIVLIVIVGGVGAGLVSFTPSTHDDPQTPSSTLTQDHEDDPFLAIVAGAVGAAVVILVGGYVLMRQASGETEMRRANRRRHRNAPAKSSQERSS